MWTDRDSKTGDQRLETRDWRLETSNLPLAPFHGKEGIRSGGTFKKQNFS
jgi:hypothetical protein